MMNERIDELMIEAGARFEFLHGVHYDDFQYKKFAELIVRECVTLADIEAERFSNLDQEYCAMAMDNYRELVLKHFGVEE
jgi:hypothetical protein